MRDHYVNTLDNFIMGWYTDDHNLCDKVIEYHKNHPNKTLGTIGLNKCSGVVDTNIKNSIDVSLKDENLIEEYGKILQQCCDEYVKKYPYSNNYSPWGIVEPINIQHYSPYGGFKIWHTERTSTSVKDCNRHLVFMTYLNDVSDDGETEFYHQKIKVKPEKGLTLIWGSDWTFTHRGIPSKSQEKYIITGWFDFL
jgi:hypothetical protein